MLVLFFPDWLEKICCLANRYHEQLFKGMAYNGGHSYQTALQLQDNSAGFFKYSGISYFSIFRKA